jgi:exopolyphosphatase/guanosine-5'-triphosphate,3'-diphosphate pyrophosphatase
MRERRPDPLLAVLDLGSNSFRLEIGRVEGNQIYQLDTWRETLRFGAGLDEKGRLKRSAMDAALACLARFRERLSGLQPAAVRVVATNTFRVASNAKEFVALAERTLGLPIDIISGHEEGRLTFFGVAHELPRSEDPRLVIDIGGGSTEFIIGRGFEPERLESLAIGCVGMTQRFFGDGAITAAALDAAETVARVEIEAIAGAFAPAAGAKPTARPARRWHLPIFSNRTFFRVAASHRWDSLGFAGACSTPVISRASSSMRSRASGRPCSPVVSPSWRRR